MKPLIPYLLFNGNCREAMNFYQRCFDGDLQLVTYAEAPKSAHIEHAKNDEIMHAFLHDGEFSLMGADWPGSEAKEGNNVQISIDCKSKSQINDLFNKLSQGGKVTMALADTFWGAHFGMLVDKYNIYWMLNYSLEK